MKIKKLLIFLIIFNIALIFNTVNVFADDDDIEVHVGATAPKKDDSSGGSGYSTNSVIPAAFGYRVTFVDATGKRVGNSVDYWVDGKKEKGCKYTFLDSGGDYYNGETCSSNGLSGFNWFFLNKTTYQDGSGKNYCYYSKKNYKGKDIEGTIKCTNASDFINSYLKTNVFKETIMTAISSDSSRKDSLKRQLNKEKGHVELLDAKTVEDCVNNLADKKWYVSVQQGDWCYNNNITKHFSYILKWAAEEATHSKRGDVYATLLKRCITSYKGQDNWKAISDASSNGYRLQVEPLAAIKESSTGKIFVGSMYEIANMFPSSGNSWLFPRFSYVNPIVFNTVNSKTLKSYAGYNDNFDALKDPNEGFGVFTIDLSSFVEIIPEKTCEEEVRDAYKTFYKNRNNMTAYDSAVTTACKKLGIDCDWLLSENILYNGKKVELDTGTFNSCSKKPTCNEAANYILQTNKNSTVNNDIIDKLVQVFRWGFVQHGIFDSTDQANLKSYKDIGKGILNLYKNYPDNEFYVGVTSFINRYSTFMLRVIFGYSFQNSVDACGFTECETALAYAKTQGLDSHPTGLGGYTSSLTYLEWLHKLFPDYDMLDPETYDGDYVEAKKYASCKSQPKCYSPNVIAKCDTSNGKVVFSDATYNNLDYLGTSLSAQQFASLTNDSDSCLSTGIGYSFIGTPTSSKKVGQGQSSKSSESFDSNSSCWESVTFNLPQSVAKSVDAGTVFKWGIDSDKSSNRYGTMTVQRYCTVGKKSSFSVNSYWTQVGSGKINPEVKMHYQEAVPSSALLKDKINRYTTHHYDMSVARDKVTTYVYYRYSSGSINFNAPIFTLTATGTTDFNKTLSNTNISKYGGVVSTTAEYNILYNDNLKWYSDKSDNFTKKSSSDIVKKSGSPGESKYTLLGYGLPTSFVTPSVPTNKNYYYGYSIDSADGRGQMYLTIKNIGTKNSGGGYHFDKYFGSNKSLTDDGNGFYSDSLVYSCGFKVQNQLYCNECTPKVGTCVGTACKPENNIPSGIDVVFRTVQLVKNSSDLKRAFPGRSGKGTRTRGANWKLSLDGSDEAYILTNEVYSYKPKYVIKLDSARIQRIRKEKYNDAYTLLSQYKFKDNRYYTGNDYLGKIAQEANKLSSYCSSTGDKGYCHREKLLSNLWAKLNNPKVSKYTSDEWNYTYAASEYLTTLALRDWLTGTCIDETNTSKRAEKYAQTVGC